MLLETLDIRKNDVLIFSQNKFDFSDNFRIVYKSNRIKYPEKISYFDVCEFVKDPIPKNLIVYRLLTNVENLDAYSTKYGYFVKINGNPELIYFDPVFAIKDIRHLRFDFEPENFRFKIQQVGLTTKGVQKIEADYMEAFSFDLKAAEAQALNDKIFADAIFVFDDTYQEEPETENVSSEKRKIYSSEIKEDLEDGRGNNLKNISEEKTTGTGGLQKLHFDKNDKSADVREAKIELLKKALGINENNIKSNRQNTSKKSGEEITGAEDQSIFDLFKSTSKFTDLEKRKNDSFILKLTKE